jgi:glycosyltransferase involved in cell wall biosynthesis
MRLAISNHALRHGGGIERYALTIVRGLHGLGIRPALIAKAFDARLIEYTWVDPFRVRVSGLPSKLRDFVFDWRIRQLKRRHDFFPLIACNQTGAADIAICGSTHPGFLEAMQRPLRWSDRWKIALERAHLTRARIIVAHSQRMADEARTYYGVAEQKIRLLYPPVDAQRFAAVDDATRRALRADFGLTDDRVAFLLVSTGHQRKGLDLLVDFFAATTLPVNLLVAGRPLPGAARVPNIRSLGYREDIENVYRAVDFTVLASRYEPFGLVGVESVLCGTPVLLARGVGCAEVIRGLAQLPFNLDASPGDSAGFAAAVDAAMGRRRDGRHRLDDPRSFLSYDSGVEAHVSALLEMARVLVVTRDEKPPA